MIHEGYNTTTQVDAMNSHDVRSDEDDDAELADNPLIIDEDYETRNDTTRHSEQLPNQIYGENDALHAIETDETVSNCLIDHDYYSTKGNCLNDFTSIYQNDNVVVMQDLFSDKFDWQKSAQRKLLEEGNQDLEFGDFDHNNGNIFDVDGLEKDEFETNKAFSNSHTTSVIFVKNKSVEKLDFSDKASSNSHTKKKALSKNQCLNKTTSSLSQDKVALEKKHISREQDSKNTVINKEGTLSDGLQSKLLKSLEPKTGENLLAPLVVPLKQEQTRNNITKTEQSSIKYIQVARNHDKIRVKRSHLNKHKITARRTYCSESSKNGSTSSAKKSDKIFHQGKTNDRSQVADSTEKAKSVASKAESENRFDSFLTGLNDTQDVNADKNQYKSRNYQAEDGEIADIIKNDTVDIKTDLDQVATGTGPVKSTENNSCEQESVEIKVLKCKECCSVFNDTTSFDLHLIWCDVEAKKSKICGVCRVAFPDLKSLNSHDCSRVSGNVEYTCGVCKKAFKKREVVFAHMKIHTKKKEFVCEVCQKSFLHKHHLVNHMNSHQSDRPFKCQVCTAAFKRVSHLQKHQASHKPDGDRKYECKHCDWAFHDKYKLERHEKTHSASVRKFVCSICQGAFREKHILTKHVKNVHSESKIAKASCSKPKQPLECEICSEMFFWKKHLRIHMASHTKALSDTDEDADDDYEDELKANDISKSSDPAEMGKQKTYQTRNSVKGFRKIKCKHCTETFASEKLLDSHTQTEHIMEINEGPDD